MPANMIRAAGILFTTKDGRGLFLQRAETADYPGQWSVPGGKLEDGESPEQAAIREAKEEAGRGVPEGKLSLLSRTISAAGPIPIEMPSSKLSSLAVPQEQVDFTTFVQVVDEPFDVEISDESVGYAWAPLDKPPQPLHPGCSVTLQRYNADELGVARMMAAGTLTSPQRYENLSLFDIRITGVGAAWRPGHKEFVYRDPQHYLNEEFLARCNGLPVLWLHPKKSLLNSEEWAKRSIGTVFLPYIKGEEVWAIAKIFDEEAASLMEAGNLSTSPAVNFADPSVNSKMQLENGENLLIEGKPSLLDHIAVCEIGVWDKGGDPLGVNATRADSTMTDEERKAEEKAKADAAAADKARKDSDDARAAKMDAAVGAMMDAAKCMADMSKRMDAMEEAWADRAKKDDAEEKKSNEATKEPVAGDEKEAERKEGKADKAKADETEMEKTEKAKADSALVAQAVAEAKELRERLDRMERARTISDDDHRALAGAQAKADAVYAAHSMRAPRPLDGETLLGYQARLVSKLQAHSARWKDVDLSPFTKDASAFAVLEGQIYADAAEAARNPANVGPGELREMTKTDRTGRSITEFVGQPKAWMSQFTPPRQVLTEISTKSA